jgi:hypothetical protein
MHLGLIAVHHRTLGRIWRHLDAPCINHSVKKGASLAAATPSGTQHRSVRRAFQPITISQTPGAPSASDTCSLAALTSSEWRCAPASSSVCTWSFNPALAAKNNGVLPARLRRWTDAPWVRKSCRISTLGEVAARCCVQSANVRNLASLRGKSLFHGRMQLLGSEISDSCVEPASWD